MKRCPFCNAKMDVVVIGTGRTYGKDPVAVWSYYVFCRGCYCKTVEKDTKRQAIAVWNLRPAKPSAKAAKR